VGAYGESPPVVIGEPQTPATDLPPEEAILFDQIRECSRSRRSSQPIIVRSNNRRTDSSITSGSLYHRPTKPSGRSRDP